MGVDVELLQEMVAALPDPVFVLTESGRYAAMAGGTDSSYYHDGSHLVGCSVHDMVPPDKAAWFLEQIHRTLDEDRLRTIEYDLAGQDVEGVDEANGPSGVLRFEGRLQPLSRRCGGERAVVWVARNITGRARLEADLRRMSETDSLTGAFNRRKMVEELHRRYGELKRYARVSSLIILDVDHFKAVNDRYGHAVGDGVLSGIAGVCMEQLRETDSLFRIGGEEFAILLPNTDVRAAQAVAERLRQSMEARVITHGGRRVSVTVSIGVSAFFPEDRSTDSIIQRADDALYEAKRDGRNRLVLAAS